MSRNPMIKEIADWLCQNVDLSIAQKECEVRRFWPSATDAQLDAASMVAITQQLNFPEFRQLSFQQTARSMRAANDA